MIKQINILIARKFFLVGLTFFLLLATTQAAEVPQDWKIECVGRYQVSFPGKVEIALRSLPSFTDNNIVNKYIFEDGTDAPYSGGYSVSHIVDDHLFDNLKNETKLKRQQRKKDLIAAGDQENADGLRPYDAGQANIFVWLAKSGATIYFFHEGRIFNLSGGDVSSTGLQFTKSTLAAFKPRQLYTIPKVSGVCIPYGFIADDGKQGHEVGVTMRLIDHPEIEIFFRDKTAFDYTSYGINQTAQTLERITISELWKVEAESAKQIDWKLPGYHSAQLAGRTGTATFAEITRKDGSKDYGYAVDVNGDPAAKVDSPELMLYVIRNASRAKGKPVSKSEFKEMALKIAASIKKRPTE